MINSLIGQSTKIIDTCKMSDYIDGDVLLAINYLMFKFMDIFREKKII